MSISLDIPYLSQIDNEIILDSKLLLDTKDYSIEYDNLDYIHHLYKVERLRKNDKKWIVKKTFRCRYSAIGYMLETASWDIKSQYKISIFKYKLGERRNTIPIN